MDEDLSKRVAAARARLARSGGASRGRGCGYGEHAREAAVGGCARAREATAATHAVGNKLTHPYVEVPT